MNYCYKNKELSFLQEEIIIGPPQIILKEGDNRYVFSHVTSFVPEDMTKKAELIFVVSKKYEEPDY